MWDLVNVDRIFMMVVEYRCLFKSLRNDYFSRDKRDNKLVPVYLYGDKKILIYDLQDMASAWQAGKQSLKALIFLCLSIMLENPGITTQ